jgi:hypothetical protein
MPPLKVCSGCSAEKPLSDFPSDKSKSDGRHSRCKECHKKRYRTLDRAVINARFTPWSREQRRSNKKLAVEFMGGKCSRCGIVGPAVIYDFHHIDPTTKKANVGRLMSNSFANIKIELEKCSMVCFNCHRIINQEAFI